MGRLAALLLLAGDAWAQTRTVSMTATLPTVTTTQTATTTVTATRSSTVTATRSSTVTATRTATTTVTATLPSRTATVTATVTLPTRSGSATLTLPSATATVSVTLPTGTGTETLTVPSATVTATVTLPTRTVTVSATMPTVTATVSVPTVTATTTATVTLPTSSVTATGTLERTVTLPSATVTRTVTATLPTGTVSQTAARTVTLPTGTVTRTVTVSVPTATQTTTVTLPPATVTKSVTVSLPTQTSTRTVTATVSRTATQTREQTATRTATRTVTVTTTVTEPATRSPTKTATKPRTGTATLTEVVTQTVTVPTRTESASMPTAAQTATHSASFPTVSRTDTDSLPPTESESLTETMPTQTDESFTESLETASESNTLPTRSGTDTESFTVPSMSGTRTVSSTGTPEHTASMPTATVTQTLPTRTETRTDTYTKTIQLGFGQLAVPGKLGPVYLNPSRVDLLSQSFRLDVTPPERLFSYIVVTPTSSVAEFEPESITLTCNGVPPDGCDAPLPKELNFTMYGVAVGNDVVDFVISQNQVNASDGAVQTWLKPNLVAVEVIDLIRWVFDTEHPSVTPRYPGESSRHFILTLTVPPLQSIAVRFAHDSTVDVQIDCTSVTCDDSTGVNRTLLTPDSYRITFHVTGWQPGAPLIEVLPAGGADDLAYYGRFPFWNSTVLEPVPLELTYTGLHVYETLQGESPNHAYPVIIKPSATQPHRDLSFHLVVRCRSEPEGLTFQGDPGRDNGISFSNAEGVKTSIYTTAPGAFDIICTPITGFDPAGNRWGSSWMHFVEPPPIRNFYVLKKHAIVPPSLPTVYLVAEADPATESGGAYSALLTMRLPYAPKYRVFVSPSAEGVQAIPSNISFLGQCPTTNEGNADLCDSGDSQATFRLRGLKIGTFELRYLVTGEDKNDFVVPAPVTVVVQGPNTGCADLTTAAECYGSWDAGCHYAGASCSSDLATFNLPTYQSQFIGESRSYTISPRTPPNTHVTLKLSGHGLTFTPEILVWGAEPDAITNVNPEALSVKAQRTAAATPEVPDATPVPDTPSPDPNATAPPDTPSPGTPSPNATGVSTPAPTSDVPDTAGTRSFRVVGTTDGGQTSTLRVVYSVAGHDFFHYQEPVFQQVLVLALLQVVVPSSAEYPFMYVGATSDLFTVQLEESPRSRLVLTPEVLPQDGQQRDPGQPALEFVPAELVLTAGMKTIQFRITANQIGRHKIGFARSGADATIYNEVIPAFIQVFPTVPVYAPPLPSLGAEEWSPPQYVSLQTSAIRGLKVRVIAAAPDDHRPLDTTLVQVARYCGTITDCRPQVPVNNVTLEFGSQTRSLAFIFRGMLPGWFGIKYEIYGEEAQNFITPDPSDFYAQQPRVWDAAAAKGGGQTGVDPRCKVSVGRLDFNSLGLSEANRENCQIGAPIDHTTACNFDSQKECERQRQEKGVACIWHGPVVGGECRYGLPDGNVTHWAIGEFHWLYRMQDGRLYSAGVNKYGQLGHSCYGVAGCNDTLEFLEVEFERRDSKGRCTQFVQKRVENVQTSATDLVDTEECVVGNSLDLVTDDGTKDPIVAVAVGSYHSMASTLSGAVFSWGSNFQGQLGLSRRPTPQQVRRPERIQLPIRDGNITCITGGAYHSLALSDKGNMWAWGSNYYGQLGHGPSYRGKVVAPVDISREGLQLVEWRLDPPVTVSAGDYHSVIGTRDGKVYSWGRNNYGQLGRVGFDDLVPTPVEPRRPVDTFHGSIDCAGINRIPDEWPESTDWTLGVVYKSIYEL